MSIIFRNGTIKDVDKLVELQLKSYDGFFMASLGRGFLRQYYRAALRNYKTICILAEDETGADLGFIIGRDYTKGYLKELLKTNILPFSLQAFKLLFTNPKAIVRLKNNLTKKSKDVQVEDGQEYAEMGLMGVNPDVQGTGVGYKLFCCFEEEIRKRGVKQLSLTTDKENNEKALTAYNRWGFKVMYEFIAFPKRKMYRFIKQVK